MKSDCIFCKIATKNLKSKLIWEGVNNLAFLTPYPNVLGFTVLASKNHKSSDIFDLDEEDLVNLIKDAKVVAALLKDKLHVARVGLIFEGYGIDHAHVKLVPMHGIEFGSWRQISSSPADRKFYETYPGFIASHDGPAMDEDLLNLIYAKITQGFGVD